MVIKITIMASYTFLNYRKHLHIFIKRYSFPHDMANSPILLYFAIIHEFTQRRYKTKNYKAGGKVSHITSKYTLNQCKGHNPNM